MATAGIGERTDAGTTASHIQVRTRIGSSEIIKFSKESGRGGWRNLSRRGNGIARIVGAQAHFVFITLIPRHANALSARSSGCPPTSITPTFFQS